MRHNARQTGAALLLVVWVVGLLSFLAAAALEITRSSARIAAGNLQREQLAAAADGAVNLALLNLAAPDERDQWPVDGSTRIVQVSDRQVEVSISDEAGKIDVNHAEPGLMRSVLLDSGNGRGDMRSSSLLKYRGESQGHRELTSFRSLEEFFAAAAVPEFKARCLREILTVYTGSDSIDWRYAGKEVRGILRRQSPGSPDFDDRATEAGSASFAGRVFSIEAVAKAEELHFARQAVVRITGDPGAPALVARWAVEDGLARSETGCTDGKVTG